MDKQAVSSQAIQLWKLLTLMTLISGTLKPCKTRAMVYHEVQGEQDRAPEVEVSPS